LCFQQTSYGYTGNMLLNITQHHPFGPLISNVTLDVYLETPDRLRIRLRNPAANRFEVPISTPNVTQIPADPLNYSVHIETTRFGIVVTRKTTGKVIFNTTIGPFVFADQFLQVWMQISSSKNKFVFCYLLYIFAIKIINDF